MRCDRGCLGLLLAGSLSCGTPVTAQTAPAAFADAADVRARIAAMEAAMGRGGFAYEPLVRDGETVGALEYWRAPGKPAVHPDEAEYAMVINGAGTLISGGTMRDARAAGPGLIEGSRIEGGTTRRLGPGDVILVPAGVPHWFGIDGRLVLLGMKLPRHGAAAPAP